MGLHSPVTFASLLVALLVLSFAHYGSSNPVPSDSGNSSILESPTNCAFSKSNPTNSSAEAEPEPATEPIAASGHDAGKNETSAPMKESLKPKTTEKPKAAGEAKSATTTTAKPTTKSAPATMTTAKPSKATEKETSPTTTATAPLKVQSREGKALDLNSTQYEHASPEPEPEAEPTGNKTHTDTDSGNKNETAKDSGKKSEKITMGPMVHENIEMKNATVTKEGKKMDDKNAHENKSKHFRFYSLCSRMVIKSESEHDTGLRC